jgi:CDP-glycerol glycerophosphotransferase
MAGRSQVAPLLSIVVPVHSVQGYLRECLDSVLDQSFTDLEVVAVDDRSPDHCPEILDEYAARDPRVRVLHLSANVGLGRARNIGLDHARGEYVWFVDSDDWIAPGSLHAIATKLRQTRPDLLLVDHTRVSWLGRHGFSEGRTLLADLDQPGCFTLGDQPDLLNLFTVAWNKIVRRDFLVGTGLRFDVGWYEDLPFTFPILVAADRIATLGRVCYHYRKRRQEAITQTTSERHFEVFDQWTRVFDRLDALGARAEVFRGPIFERMLWHLLVVQAAPDRLPAGTRRAYFSRLSEHYRRYAPTTHGNPPAVAGHPRPPISRLNRLRRRLIARDRYRAFRGLRLTRLSLGRVRRRYRRARRLARSAARWMRTNLRAAAGRSWYALQRRLPIDDRLALYAAYWYRGVNCNPAAIDVAARRLVPEVRSVWVLDADRVEDAPPGTTYVVNGTLAYYRALARARWLINNVNFPDFVVKRPGTVHVQTHHGTPVKVMGLDQAKYPVGAQGMNLELLMRRCDRWDFSITSNAHSTEVWSRSYPCRYTTLEYGYPRNDRLALATAADVAKARALLGIDDARRVVLYAPTHREYQPGFQPFLALDEFADALGPDTLVLQRAHYFYVGTPPAAHRCVWDVSAYPIVEDLLLAADVLVSDYSSVLFDFAVLDRPIVVYAPDWDTYRRTRGVTFDLLAEPPGVVATSQAELQAAFHSGAVESEAADKARAQFRARFCYLDDGFAAERVVRRVFGDEAR